MNLKRRPDQTPRPNLYTLGIKEYGRHDVEINTVDYGEIGEELVSILQEALDVHAFNNRPADDFNDHPDNRRARRAYKKLPLPEGADPHGPVLQLAQAGIRKFGFAAVVSIDSAKLMETRDITERAANWMAGIGRHHNQDTGLVLFVERSEDADNERLRILKESASKLVVPRLAIVTTAAPEGAPLEEELALDKKMLRPDTADPGPGMEML